MIQILSEWSLILHVILS